MKNVNLIYKLKRIEQKETRLVKKRALAVLKVAAEKDLPLVTTKGIGVLKDVTISKEDLEKNKFSNMSFVFKNEDFAFYLTYRQVNDVEFDSIVYYNKKD